MRSTAGRSGWRAAPCGRVDARGKHLFLRFEGDLTLHSHLRMTGKWGVYERGQRWRRSPRRAWLVIRTEDHEVVQFDGPVLELMTDSRTRFDQAHRRARPGPDRRRLRRGRLPAPPARGRPHARHRRRRARPAHRLGIGNIWKCEACFLAGIDPWRKAGDLSDDEALAIVREARPRMRESAVKGGRITTPGRVWVHERAGLPCRRCGTPIRARGQGDDNRTTYWCPGCQA